MIVTANDSLSMIAAVMKMFHSTCVGLLSAFFSLFILFFLVCNGNGSMFCLASFYFLHELILCFSDYFHVSTCYVRIWKETHRLPYPKVKYTTKSTIVIENENGQKQKKICKLVDFAPCFARIVIVVVAAIR